ncbi:plasma membrane proteolipid 3 [Penicillium verhagenii]|uniref:plasma membrane proteolipid 3 n=1 Tax=Penicillium verhagenii TaxID=1562060 RepID=UPI0025457E6F|nr:plasma membrane proteolipid 3 [Penicillium verhagenii]KAJ5924861.1 plasma membrane proteolipid 3 [Penicillium verhagenii]
MPFTASDICKIIFAIILPPLGVFLERGCGADLLINICLTILGWLPGVIHALYVLPHPRLNLPERTLKLTPICLAATSYSNINHAEMTPTGVASRFPCVSRDIQRE